MSHILPQIEVEDIYATYPPPRPPQKKKDAVFKLSDYAAIDKKATQVCMVEYICRPMVDMYIVDICIKMYYVR